VLSLRRRRALVPYLLLAPGLLWLGVFYLWPALTQAYVSLEDGDVERGFTFQWNWSTYGDAISQYDEHILRSLGYAGTATLLALVICFPLAYFIAFKAGRWKNVLLLLIVLPFFTSYLVRTGAWQLILADDAWAVDVMRALGLLGVLGEADRLLDTRTAVIAGITYNYLPFMALPLYVSLEKIDKRLIEAATDLYASRVTAFRKVTVRLALPGIFAGVLLTFIPAVGDFINAELLGSSREVMIGNVIQSKFLEISDYPEAAALSFVMMAVILAVVVVAARLLGGPREFTEGIT
jgi:spermidine/putrescine transport system permease protein